MYINEYSVITCMKTNKKERKKMRQKESNSGPLCHEKEMETYVNVQRSTDWATAADKNYLLKWI